ncbi:MAG: transposase, partial [Opitutales bacterium]
VRAGLVEDPKDYRFCGYAEAIAGQVRAEKGLRRVWAARAGGDPRSKHSLDSALQLHREFIFGKRAADPGLPEMSRQKALQVLEKENAILPKAAVLRCRVRYFTDGAILGSAEYVKSFAAAWQAENGRKHPPKMNQLKGADWQGLAVIQGLRRKVFD